MSDLIKLPATQPFVLDDRTIAARLEYLKEYCSNIPFGEDAAHHWDEVLFGSGATATETLASLARLYDDHALADGTLPPQQAFLLAFYEMLKTPTRLLNELPAKHRNLYYRDLLRLQERGAVADRVTVSFQLDEATPELLLPVGLLLDGGQDGNGTPLHYALDEALLANQGRLTDVRWCAPATADGKSIQRARVVLSEPDMLWPAGGVRLFDVAGDTAAPVVTGRIVGSEALAMSGGTRTITVTFAADIAPADVTAAVTICGQWCALPSVSVKDKPKELLLTVAPEEGPVSPPAGLDGFDCAVPLLKIARSDGQPVPTISSIAVQVDATPDVLYSSDDGLESLNRPSYPFGHEPHLGARINLVSADWYKRNLKVTVTLRPVWLDLPSVWFAQWYAGYPTPPKQDDVFKGRFCVASRSGPVKAGEAQSLFRAQALPANPVTSLKADPQSLNGKPSDSKDPVDWPTWLRFELAGSDFLHGQYRNALNLWGVAGAKAMRESIKPAPSASGSDAAKSATAPATDTDKAKPEPNPPYTPRWEALRVDYSCEDKAITERYVLTPFGTRVEEPTATEPDTPQLYLGFDSLNPGQQITLHWQLRSPQRQQLDWTYLDAKDAWRTLGALPDRTEGLFRSGRWSTPLPADASRDARRMPAGRYWLRATVKPMAASDAASTLKTAATQKPAEAQQTAVPQQTTMVPDQRSDEASLYPLIEGIHVNAGQATLVDPGSLDDAHFRTALPPGTIRQTVATLDGLEGVAQPWASEGGRAPEQPAEFFARVARRLSHRARALTWWDMELLLREQFPEIGQIQVASPLSRDQQAPLQRLVVIPAYGNADNASLTKPRFGAERLDRMQHYLTSRASPWLSLALCNAEFRDVKVRYAVEFQAGVNAGDGYARLQQALEREYMPWSIAGGGAATTGTSLDYYAMLAFIQALDFVERVSDLQLDGWAETLVAGRTEVFVLACVAAYDSELSALPGKTGGYFGTSISLSADGSVLAVGAPYAGGNKGELYVFTRGPGGWSGAQTLGPPGLVKAGDYFGWSVALSGDGRLLAASAASTATANEKIYIYRRNGMQWAEGEPIQRPRGESYDKEGYFGYCLAMSADGRRLVASARSSEAKYRSRIYAFDFVGNSSSSSVPLPEIGKNIDGLGSSLALSGDGQILAVTAPLASSRQERVYVYRYSPSEKKWALPSKILAPDTLQDNDGFGSSIALNHDGTVVAVGAKKRNGDVGAVFTFNREPSSDDWSAGTPVPGNANNDGWFGASVSLNRDGTQLAVGASYATTAKPREWKGAYLFRRDGAEWRQQRKRVSRPSAGKDGYGSAVCLSADGATLAVSAPDKDTGLGSVHVYADQGKS